VNKVPTSKEYIFVNYNTTSMPIDINELRTYRGGDPEKWRKHMAARFKPAEWVDEVIAADEAWRDLTNEKDALRKKSNKIQKEVIFPAMKAKPKIDCSAAIAENKSIQVEIKLIENEKLPAAAAVRDKLLNRIGNVVDRRFPSARTRTRTTSWWDSARTRRT